MDDGLMDDAAAGTTTDLRLHEVPAPTTVDAPEAWTLRGVAEVSAAVELECWGNDDLTWTPSEILAHLRRQDHAVRIRLAATSQVPGGGPGPAASDPGSVLGSAGIDIPTAGNTHLAFVEIVVRPEARHRGIGRALLADAERIAADHGRRTLIASTQHRAEPAIDDPHALVAPTGSGRISAADHDATFALAAGYTLEQAERYSVLTLPVRPSLLRELHDDAARKAGPDYRLITWGHRTPDEWAEQHATLFTRMSTEVPTAGLEMEEDPWDVGRLRATESDTAAAGQGSLTVVAEHVPSRTLAAFTTVTYPLDRPEVVFQGDTLVLREHRGRRLGMLVKTALLEHLRVARPGAKRIHTWNAEENAHMLGINVALGFEPTGVCGMWQKKTR
jgi:GNAT superfamily N-acetyltransferase